MVIVITMMMITIITPSRCADGLRALRGWVLTPSCHPNNDNNNNDNNSSSNNNSNNSNSNTNTNTNTNTNNNSNNNHNKTGDFRSGARPSGAPGE